MNKGYKYRIYPITEQENLLSQTFGCCRFVYNKLLTLQQENYKNTNKYMTRVDTNNYCNHVLKTEFPFLKKVDKFAVTNAVFALDNAYHRFFAKQGGFPKFKNKHRIKKIYTTSFTTNNIEVLENKIKLPKLGIIKAVLHCRIPVGYKIKSATVSQERDGSFYCSILCEYNTDIVPICVQKVVGLDYKSDGIYATSDFKVCGSPKYYRKSEDRLSKYQRKLKNMQKQSSNYKKQQLKIAKIYRHEVNQRKDFLHKKSTEIANQYNLVCVEDLNMRSMSNKGFGDGKATLDNGYGMFLNMLAYKLKERRKKLQKVGKWYASSQICSCCGAKHKLSLSEREYHCECGTIMDRDFNAAINIRNEGYSIYLKNIV